MGAVRELEADVASLREPPCGLMRSIDVVHGEEELLSALATRDPTSTFSSVRAMAATFAGAGTRASGLQPDGTAQGLLKLSPGVLTPPM